MNKIITSRFLILFLTSFILGVFESGAQTSITGKVTDESNVPVPGISVLVKGTTVGAMTGAGGTFTISPPAGALSLVFSGVGYTAAEVAIKNQTVINVSLKSSVQGLNEVVVTGYNSQRKKDLTGAVAVVDIKQLKTQPAANVVEALQGKAAGVQVTNSSTPGGTALIRIRGYGTINNNDPLYVIDGVPVKGNLNFLNQNDVESMQVLKDAASASIFGSRAGNGVVIITTKRGQKGAPKITFDAYYGTQRHGNYPQFLNTSQYANFLWQIDNNSPDKNGTITHNSPQYGTGANPVIPDYILAGSKPGVMQGDPATNPSLYNYDPDNPYLIVRANKQGTNWLNVISRPAAIQSYQVGASGGSDNAKYSFSAGYFDQQGIIRYTDFKRYNVRANTQFSALKNHFRIGETAQISQTQGTGFGTNNNSNGDYQGESSPIAWAFRMQPIVPVFDIAGNFGDTKGNGLGNSHNPLAVLSRQAFQPNKNLDIIGDIYAEADLLPGLTFKTDYGLTYDVYSNNSFDPRNPETSEPNSTNTYSQTFSNSYQWKWTNQLTYKKVFARVHALSVLAGYESVENDFNGFTASRQNYALTSPSYLTLDGGTQNKDNSTSNAGSPYVYRLASFFGRADYSFKDKYLLSATIRRDGSSRFGTNNLYGNFPAFSAAWRLSQESFMKKIEWINDLKIRAGYGKTGNQEIGNYNSYNQFITSFNQSDYDLKGTSNKVETGYKQSYLGNPNVKWESTSSEDIGLDATLAANTIDFTFDWYSRKTSNMLFQTPQPASAGNLTSPYENVGEMSNKGLEASLNYHGSLNNNAFKYNVGINGSHNTNQIIKLNNANQPIFAGNTREISSSILTAGHPIGEFYGWLTNGLFRNQQDVTASPSQSGAIPGSFKFQDLNKDGKIDGKDRTFLGSPLPKLLYGISLDASFRNFDFSAFFNGSYGNKIFEQTRYFTDFPTFQGQRSTRVLNSWTPQNLNASTPIFSNNNNNDDQRPSNYYVQPASFLRCKNITLGYSLPNSVTEKIHVSKLRFYVQGANLFTVTRYDGLDPEVGLAGEGNYAIGVDKGVSPLTKQYILGLNASF